MRPSASAILGSIILGLVLVSLISARAGFCADMSGAIRAEALRPDAASGPTRIAVGAWFADVSRIDSAAQTFTANLFFTLSWRDPGLAHGQPGVRQYNLKDIWHPNWIPANAASKLEASFPEIAEVAGDGTVYVRQRYLGSYAESLDLRAFPFDKATFRMHFVSVGQGQNELQFVPSEAFVAIGMPNGAGLAKRLTLQDWRITGFTARPLPYQVAPSVDMAGYAFEFQAERLQQHYIIKVIIPLLLIVMMSWMVFWIDPSLGSSQISVAVTSMLTLIAYRFAIGNEVPKLPYLTTLDAFILISTALVFLALIEVIVTTAMWYNERRTLAQSLDRYCRWVFPSAFLVLNAAVLLR